MKSETLKLMCNQKGCERAAAFRFTWPGRDEAGICVKHAPHARMIAAAIGLHLQMIPIPEAEGECA